MSTQKNFKESLKTHIRKGKIAVSVKMIIARIRVMRQNHRIKVMHKRASVLQDYLNQVHFEHTVAMEQYESKK